MRTFEIHFTDKARLRLNQLKKDKGNKVVCKAVLKTLAFMETNLRHPSLNTHEFKTLIGPSGEKVFESYVQNRTANAYRIFWYYGPGKNSITVSAIIPHP